MLQRLLDSLKAWLVPDPELSLEKQLFQGLCQLAGLLSVFVILPVNSFQKLPVWENGIILLFGLELLALAWAARRGRYLKATTLLSAVICLDLIWFPNGGSQGSIGLYFFAAALFLVVFFKGVTRLVAFALLVADVIGLHLAERAWHQLVHPFTNGLDRFLDLSTGYLFSLLICAGMLWVVLSGLHRERRQLAESETFYRETLERQGEGFGMVDAEERFIFVNPVAEAIFGVPPGGLLGRNLMEFLGAAQQRQVREETGERKAGRSSTYELDIQRPDGDVRTILVTATPRPREDGALLQIIAVFRDITEWKQAEAGLRESEEKFRTYVEQSNDVIFTLDAEGTFLFVSPAWGRHLGYPGSDVLGQSFARFLHPEDAQPSFDYLAGVLSTGEGATSPPYRLRHADGSWRWFRANGTRLANPDGKPRFMAVAHDITERKQAEEALRLSEERYRVQFDRASEGILTFSPEGDILEVNESMARMHGYTIEEMRNLSLKDLNTPETSRLSPERLRRLMAGETLTIELEHFHKDGHAFPLEVSASLISTGDRPSILTFNRDITERKRAEETVWLLEQEKQQTQKMDSLGILAGGVAHDFNNMLGGIMGYADLLLASEQDPVRQKFLRSILAAASRSSELTQKLLAFGRRGKNRAESLALPSMVEECLAMLRPTMSPDIRVVVDMAGCPPVDGDPSQIHQVLVNLCINAIEAMPERGTLSLSAHLLELSGSSLPGFRLAPGPYVELVVSDTGLGMTEETRQRIFEPFFTTKNSSRMTGTGLGLSTAYGIIQAHRGAITVHSIRGKGSTFRVFLPVGVLSPKDRESLGESSQGRGVILLVEDEPLLRELGTAVLQALGYEVLTAGDGREAVQVYRRENRTLRAVLLDLKMPIMGGREAFLEFRNINPGVPVLICTGFGENEEVQELLTLGAVGMLAKPYKISDLAMKLGQAPPR
jgi:PAS domain S-box-containing protein